jgi:hypothetical protein
VEVHVGEMRHLGVARVHAPHVRAERHLAAVRIGGIGEVVVAARVRAERRVVRVGASVSGAPLRQRPTSFAASSSRSCSV